MFETSNPKAQKVRARAKRQSALGVRAPQEYFFPFGQGACCRSRVFSAISKHWMKLSDSVAIGAFAPMASYREVIFNKN